jgi:hypothetical protein
MWRWATARVPLTQKTSSQRHITPNATEEIKLDSYRAIAVRAETMAVITFVDRVVFHIAVENRILFHELVHVIQYQKTRTWFCG